MIDAQDYSDGCDCYGFKGGCKRAGHDPESCPTERALILDELQRAGGSTHGPVIETVSIPLDAYVAFRRKWPRLVVKGCCEFVGTALCMCNADLSEIEARALIARWREDNPHIYPTTGRAPVESLGRDISVAEQETNVAARLVFADFCYRYSETISHALCGSPATETYEKFREAVTVFEIESTPSADVGDRKR